jgi:hypothetical protein
MEIERFQTGTAKDFCTLSKEGIFVAEGEGCDSPVRPRISVRVGGE